MQATGGSTIRRSLALALAALTGCSHVHVTTTRHPKDRVEQVERRPDGRDVRLELADPAPDVLRVTAEEREMCRELERGTRTFELRTVRIRQRGAHPLADFGSGCNVLCLPVALVLLPILIVITVAGAIGPDESSWSEQSDDPPVRYEKWRPDRVACGEHGRPAPDEPLRLELRRAPSDCVTWSARTGADGAVALAPLLSPAAAAEGPCRGWLATGQLLIAGAAGPGEEAAPGARTVGALVVPLRPEQAAALGVAPPDPGTLAVPPPWAGREVAEARVAEAVGRCAHRLDRTCREALHTCLQRAEEKGDVAAARSLCWHAAPYCEPATGSFEWCLQDQLR